jgi:hypothetical protein
VPACSASSLRSEPAQNPGRITDGHRFTAFITDTEGGQLADLETRHRSHARIEDRIRGGKTTGLRNFPCRGYPENKAWLDSPSPPPICSPGAQALCFTGDLTRAEPATFRYRICAIAGKLARTARVTTLHLDQDWPWAQHLANAFTRLPGPAEPRPSARRPKDPRNPLADATAGPRLPTPRFPAKTRPHRTFTEPHSPMQDRGYGLSRGSCRATHRR